jgi:hypothetical protein
MRFAFVPLRVFSNDSVGGTSMKRAAVYGFTLFMIASGCGSPAVDGDTWLVATENDTVTVREAGVLWEGLEESDRAFFARSDNPSREFVEALAGKAALEVLLDSSGILDDPDLTAFTSSWLRVESAIRARSLLAHEEMASVNDSDLDFFRAREGVMAWFTLEDTGPIGPLPLTELPRELASALNGLSPGQSVVLEEYGSVALDSLYDNMPHSRPSAEPDSTLIQIIGYGRERFHYLKTYYVLRSDPGTLVSQGLGDISSIPEDSVVVSSPLGEWTRGQLEQELRFFQTRVPYLSSGPEWIDMITENLFMQSHFKNLLQARYPAAADSVVQASLAFSRRRGAELLMREHVLRHVEVTREDLEREYSLLSEPVLTAERRVFATASSGIEDLDRFRSSLLEPGGPESFPPVPGLSASQDSPGVTVPLMRVGLPGNISSALFDIDADDTTTWMGPFEIEPGFFGAFRLLEVIPPRPATIDELEDRLRDAAQNRLEAEYTDGFLLEQRNRFGVKVNEQALRGLPASPELWKEI